MIVKTKRFFLLQVLLVVLVTGIGQIGKAQMPKCGIQEVRTLDQVYELDIILSSVLEDEDYDSFVKYKEDYVEDVEDAAIVAVIKPTGNIHTYYLNARYEIVVERVIKGDQSLENKVLHLFDSYNFAVSRMSEDKLGYHDIKNAMQPDHVYLAFFSPVELNNYLEEDAYRLDDSFFNYLDLDNDNTVPIDSPEQTEFKEVKEFEFFASSQRMLDVLIEIKQKIIEKYI